MALLDVAGKSPGRANPKRDAALQFSAMPGGIEAFAKAVDQAGAICITDSRDRILHVSEGFLRLSGYTRKELFGKNLGFLSVGINPASVVTAAKNVLKHGQPWRGTIGNRAKDGSIYRVEASIAPLKSKAPKKNSRLYILIDVTTSVHDKRAFENSPNFVHEVLNNLPSGLSVVDKDRRLVFCNDVLKKLLGLPEELFDQGMPSLGTIDRHMAKHREFGSSDSSAEISSLLKPERSRVYAATVEHKRPDGSLLEIRRAPLKNGGFITSFTDVTDFRRDQRKITQLVQHDTLTGLVNRRFIQDRLRAQLSRLAKNEAVSFLALNLDRFKSVNDRLGHQTGDKLLEAVAKRLKSCVREIDTIARLGGDEFGLLLSGGTDLRYVKGIAQRIIDSVSKPYKVAGNSLSIGSCIGIAIAPTDADDAETLMKNADLALQRAKAEGQDRFCFFEQEMQLRAQRHLAVQEGLKSAVTNNEFELHYQPIFRIADRRPIGCEALIRWWHPRRGLIPASEFIPIAEETGLICKIGEWALNTACKEATRWPRDVSIAVNISPAQFHGQDLGSIVPKALNGLDPSRLVIEITESLLLQDSDSTLNTLARLRAIGIRFALDDFGTGYSSLSYLQGFPFDKIKIDRSFVSKVTNAERSSLLRRSIMQLGSNLGMTTVAEGVETEDQLAQLLKEGCIEAQGYLFSKAVPASELERFFSRRNDI